MASMPNASSPHTIFFLSISGSSSAVKKPVAEKQTSATDTLAYFTLP